MSNLCTSLRESIVANDSCISRELLCVRVYLVMQSLRNASRDSIAGVTASAFCEIFLVHWFVIKNHSVSMSDTRYTLYLFLSLIDPAFRCLACSHYSILNLTRRIESLLESLVTTSIKILTFLNIISKINFQFSTWHNILQFLWIYLRNIVPDFFKVDTPSHYVLTQLSRTAVGQTFFPFSVSIVAGYAFWKFLYTLDTLGFRSIPVRTRTNLPAEVT